MHFLTLKTNRNRSLTVWDFWRPALLGPSLTLWLDGADETTVTSDVDGVSEWRDKSGFARHAVGTGSRKPTYITNALNNRGAMDFTTRSAEKLDTVDFDFAPSRKFCSVCVVQGAGLGPSNYRRIWVSKGTNPDSLAPGSTYTEGYLGSGSGAQTALHVAGGSGLTAPLVTVPDTGAQMISSAFGTAGLSADVAAVAANGGTRDTLSGQTGTLGSTGIRIGNDVGTLGDNRFNGWIAEIIFTSDITFENLQNIEGYLAWKWAIVSKLPSDHPYKNAPPFA